MTKDQVRQSLERVPTWPKVRHQELTELVLEIEAEFAVAAYEATPDELTAIDEGLASKAASEEEIKAAFATFWRADDQAASRRTNSVSNSKRNCAPSSSGSHSVICGKIAR